MTDGQFQMLAALRSACSNWQLQQLTQVWIDYFASLPRRR